MADGGHGAEKAQYHSQQQYPHDQMMQVKENEEHKVALVDVPERGRRP